MIVLRVIVGAGEGFVFPSCSTLLAAWTPLKERSIAVSVVFSGGMIGSVIGSSCSGILIEKYGWTSVFYVFGGISVIWCIVFVSHKSQNRIQSFETNFIRFSPFDSF